MANRDTLHINKLDDFKKYLDSQGIAYRPGKGAYQVLQVQTSKHGWQCIFKRHNMPEHYSINDKLYPLVRQFLNANKIPAGYPEPHGLRRIVLLKAAHALLKKCEEGPFVKNALEETVFYDGTECDGYCLMNDIADELGLED